MTGRGATTGIVIVAAGRGTRAGGPLPKQWQAVAGAPVARWTLQALAPHGRIILVIHPEDEARAACVAEGLLVTLVPGAGSRAGSVLAGLEALAQDPPERVLIHDVARPCVSPAVIGAVLAALETHDGAAPALPVTDALWTGAGGRVTGTQSREGLFRAQTPQGFRFDAILQAHRTHDGTAADDVEVARAAGLEVAIVPGEESNIKITAPGDFARAAKLLEPRMDVRLGNGYDVHAFTTGDHVVLCGVRVPHDRALKGHSDADVGMHAATDAIYGALAEGDIGRHFPPSDPQWKGAASEIFLRHAVELARSKGFDLGNVDVTLVCERPKIGPHAAAMQQEIARILGVEIGRVSVKATTSERLGFTGREEGIAALATATLVTA
ncbi:bifunctional 2-C-methyl-D-erythritol 4-phosphate cytidylyltransferase/2-C-methyl-D-erythritol 2,4-cyclodiphosphate synthase [Pseudoponticoccus marisrubri]|uniref:Bifunctional enzyme IspD/IspF n=1 Tax=Pseudoponticoccus marisrubri TaxID=1685382 RepID=A0A0W7WP22_9RHOB|nr:bifunctional 2-C-methyl-D-erythritol 4-phosphate cytidylyltransferase/2-C-methyl-D-erythritol 2,4-cyclodiphosphate synthase [Pseudoponticoccus marisrubri]KUF12350.1 2-C-methyl-D-erythritol 2,4-cyclodiphosphate synthase [Pseudoponticoccus marisrubri]